MKYIKFVALLLLAILIMSCSGNKEPVLTDMQMLNGEWSNVYNDNGDTHIYKLNDGLFESFDEDGVCFAKGTFSLNGDEIDFDTTQIFFAAQSDDSTKVWFTKDEFAETHAGLLEKWATLTPPVTLDKFFHAMTYKYALEGDELQLSYPTAKDMEHLGMTYDEILENSSSMRNHIITPEWTTTVYSRVGE